MVDKFSKKGKNGGTRRLWPTYDELCPVEHQMCILYDQEARKKEEWNPAKKKY